MRHDRLNLGKQKLLENAILIAGPTASGKSSLALELARHLDAVVVNADSMQVYATLRILTARPGDDDLARAPHWLYGHVDPATLYSTGMWARDVSRLIDEGGLAGRRAIFVGGTGLYFRALMEGLSEMPPVPDAIRRALRGRLEEAGPVPLHHALAERDPGSASRIGINDGQRIVRALEILESTGRSIADLQAVPGRPLVAAASARCLVLEPERDELALRIDQRFEAMMEAGVLDEVAALRSRRLDPALPAMKAIGVRELCAMLAGELSRADAVARAKAATRRYAKRQATWFRHQMGGAWLRAESREAALQCLTDW